MMPPIPENTTTLSKAEQIQAIQDAVDKWLTENVSTVVEYLEWRSKERTKACDKQNAVTEG